MRQLFRKKFEMMTSWTPVMRCRVCDGPNRGLDWKWHFPDLVLNEHQDGGQPLDLEAAVTRRIGDNRRQLKPCDRTRRCK